MAEAKVWRNATNTERLVGDIAINMRSKTLKTAVSILIATWLTSLSCRCHGHGHGRGHSKYTFYILYI